MNLVKGSLQSELNLFFQHKNNLIAPIQKVTASAFCKARKKFSYTAFIELNHRVTQSFYQQVNIKKWHGLRVLAVDGSRYLLPNSPEIKRTFGGQSNQYHGQVPMALGSCLYDVFQGVVLDAQFEPYRSNERELAYQHLEQTQDKDLILYDRGYPSFWFFAAHHKQHRDYCMRVTESYNRDVKAFVKSNKNQQLITLKPDAYKRRACRQKNLSEDAFTVRLVRIKLGKKHYILMTSLLDKKRFSIKDLKALYHLRWQVEEGYKKQKSWIEIENFSGKSVLSVKQDFYARVLSLSLTAIAVYEAQFYIRGSVDNRQYAYKINFAQSLSSMKNTMVKLLYNLLSTKDITLWLQSIGRSLSAIRPNRSFYRKNPRFKNGKFHFSYKRAL